jgi:two-component system chemotaxis response regulator CheB
MAHIRACGGFTVVQHPGDAQVPVMPLAAIHRCDPNLILPLERIHALLPMLPMLENDKS